MKLNARVFGEGQDLIILHGLYGSGDNWLTIARQFASSYRVHLPDQRNHGHSVHDSEHSYQAMVSDLMEYISDNGIISPVILGHSMGGKTAMWLSVLHPDIPSHLIVVDISPVGYARLTNTSGLIEQHLNIINAMRVLNLENYSTRHEIDQALSAYVPSDKVRQFLIKSIDRESSGGFRWKLNVEAIANFLPEIMGGIDISKYSPRVNQGMPVLFVRGEHSEYIKEEDQEAIKSLYPRARIETVYDAGHWIHAEQPSAFIAVVKDFLELNE